MNAKENKTTVLKNDLSEIRKLHAAVDEFGRKHGLTEDVTYDIRLALEEIVVNIIRYAYEDDNEHQIVIRFLLKRRELILEVNDDGKPFNPLKFPKPDVDKPLEEREQGGLGIYLARNSMDDMAYKRGQGKNVVTMKKML